jgi:hypothetical protein
LPINTRSLHVVHLLIRSWQNDGVCFLIHPHEKWTDEEGNPYWSLPTKKTVADPVAQYLHGTSIERFIDGILQDDLKLSADDYALEQEIEPASTTMKSPTHDELTDYVVFPVDVWVNPARHSAIRAAVNGSWLSCHDAACQRRLSETTKAVFRLLTEREVKLTERYSASPKDEEAPEAPRRLLQAVADQLSMEAMAKKWLGQNRGGVRHLSKKALDDILAAGNRAFNLRVADPYLRYQMQGLGFTWSFFTHKDA